MPSATNTGLTPPRSINLYRVCGWKGRFIEAAEKALEFDDPECRELAEQLLREVRKVPT
jgi:hypothetical protein